MNEDTAIFEEFWNSNVRPTYISKSEAFKVWEYAMDLSRRRIQAETRPLRDVIERQKKITDKLAENHTKACEEITRLLSDTPSAPRPCTEAEAREILDRAQWRIDCDDELPVIMRLIDVSRGVVK